MAIDWKPTALELVLAAVPDARVVVAAIKREDRALADQLRRAISSVALNLAEADGNNGGNRRLRLESARGSALDSACALRLAVAWGYVSATDVEPVLTAIDRAELMTWTRLERGRRATGPRGPRDHAPPRSSRAAAAPPVKPSSVPGRRLS